MSVLTPDMQFLNPRSCIKLLFKTTIQKKGRPKIADSLLIKACELRAILGVLFLSDEVTMNPLLFYMSRLILVNIHLAAMCSRTSLTIHILNYSKADEVQFSLALKEDLGRP